MRPRNPLPCGADVHETASRSLGVTTIIDELIHGLRDYLAGFDDETLRGFAGGINWSMPARPLEPNTLACLAHLDRVAEIASPRARRLAGLLSQERDAFRWGQTYTAADFGRRFMENYGWLEVFGTRGHFVNDEVAGGFLILGPDVLYPDHHHVAEEIYIPLTGGAEWRMAGQPFQRREAGEIVHHASGVSHAMRTGSEPLLALYLWRGGPLAERSTVTGRQEAR
jgi:mannose-6-phosphate isomerase-like protein (cupin superfamily)